MPVNRWYVRCQTCLVITAIDARPAYGAVCGLCQGPIETMGRVERERLIEEHLECKCDDRCTSARGPLYSCKCGGVNHGAGLLGGYHLVTTDKGPVPTVTPKAGLEQARINAREYTEARTAVLAILDRLNAARNRGYLPRADFDQLVAVRAALRKSVDSRSHRHRMTALRAVLPASAIFELAQAINDAPKIAEVPFTLRAQAAPETPATQTTLF
jgi:hypothetical protein